MKHELIASATANSGGGGGGVGGGGIGCGEPDQQQQLQHHQHQQQQQQQQQFQQQLHQQQLQQHLQQQQQQQHVNRHSLSPHFEADFGCSIVVGGATGAGAGAGLASASASILGAGSSALPLPAYPAPVGRRLNWTFREKPAGNDLAGRDLRHDVNDKHRTLTLDLIPDDAHIVHSPPLSSQSHSTPPSTSQHPHHTQQQLLLLQQSNQSQQLGHRKPVPPVPAAATTGSSCSSTGAVAASSGATGTMSNQGSMQRASTLPRNQFSSANGAGLSAVASVTAQSRLATGAGYRSHGRYPDGGHSSSAAYMLGLYGWRKRCLFVLICALIALIVMNLALTLWILKVMEFSADGMGSLKVVAGGLQLSGQALVLDLLKASTIRSKHGQPISIESTKNFTVNTRDWDGRIENQLFLGHDRFDILSHSLQMYDAHGTAVFTADKNEVRIGANVLRVDGEGGVVFRDSVQTPLIRAEPGRELKLESPTRSVHVSAGQDVVIKSAAGSLDAACLNDIRLRSEAGSIRLDAASILLPNLRTALPPTAGDHRSTGSGSGSGNSASKVYQLCACANGKLFLALSHGVCAGDEASVCR